MLERETYNYCRVCGHQPKTERDEKNVNRRWWDPDDGWKLGAICPCCWEEVRNDKPKPTDYAYTESNGVADDVDTDDDLACLLDL
jgi:hypothetical protein